MNTVNNSVNLDRDVIETFAAEIETNDGLRIVAAMDVFNHGFDEAEHGEEAVYVLRDRVADSVGFERADAGDDNGIFVHRAFLALRAAYGQDWVRSAYEHFLVSFVAVPCGCPETVVDRKVSEIERRYREFMEVA